MRYDGLVAQGLGCSERFGQVVDGAGEVVGEDVGEYEAVAELVMEAVALVDVAFVDEG